MEAILLSVRSIARSISVAGPRAGAIIFCRRRRKAAEKKGERR